MANPTPTLTPAQALTDAMRYSGLIDDTAGDGALYYDIAAVALAALAEAGYQVRPHPGASREQWQADELSNLISDVLSWAPDNSAEAVTLRDAADTHASTLRGPAAVNALVTVLDRAMPFVPTDMVPPITLRRTEILAAI